MNKTARAILIGAGAFLALQTQSIHGADQTPQVPYPAAAKAKKEYGSIGLTIVFGQDGSVKSVEVTNSSAKTKELEDGTRAYIMKNWKAPSLASTSQTTVMHFNAPGAGAAGGKKGQPVAGDKKPQVPYPAQADGMQRSVQLRVSVTYNADGTVKSAHVLNSSMDNIYFSREASSFIKGNWIVPSEADSTQTETVNIAPGD